MVMTSFLRDCKVVPCSPDATGGTSDIDGAVIDMGADGGYNAVAFVAHLGDVSDTCVLELQCRGSANSDGSASSQEATTGTRTANAANSDDKLVILDVQKPAGRYVFPRLKRGTANAALNSIIAVVYKANNLPATPSADVVLSALAIVR